MGEIRLKRAYDKPAKNDGRRVLVDRLWPRGVKKEALELDDWFKEVAPSNDLRHWFGHDPERWEGFKQRYSGELQSQQQIVDDLCSTARQGRLTHGLPADQQFLEESTRVENCRNAQQVGELAGRSSDV